MKIRTRKKIRKVNGQVVRPEASAKPTGYVYFVPKTKEKEVA